MKRTLLSALAILLISMPSFSQETRVYVNKDAILKKLQRSDDEIANPKKAANVRTWLNRAKLYYDAETAVSGNIFNELNTQMTVAMFGRPTGQGEVVEIGGDTYNKLPFEHFIAYIKDDMLVMWEVTTVVKDGAIDESTAAYNKAYELDAAHKESDKIAAGLKKNFDYLFKRGATEFTLGKYDVAANSFVKAIETGLNSPGMSKEGIAEVPAVAYNAGLAYYFVEDYASSVKYFTMAESLGYEGDGYIYYILYYAYKGYAGEDKEVLAQVKPIIEKGMDKYPDNANVIEVMTDMYVALGEDPNDIVPNVLAAIDKDPNNPSLWNGLGRLYDRLGDTDKSIDAFEHLVTLAPDDFGVNYSLGLLYVRMANARMDEINKNASSFKGQAEYDAAKVTADEIFLKAVPRLEKAHTLNPSDSDVISYLKAVTFRLREYEGMMAKYEKYSKLDK